MNDNVLRYYHESFDKAQSGNFHKVIEINKDKLLSWEEVSKVVSNAPKGWYELVKLSSEERLEFTRDFWLSKIPFSPHIHEAIISFFEKLEDIGIYITQKNMNDPYEMEMVYSLADNSGFFHGKVPISNSMKMILKCGINDYLLPEDYLMFLQIHNGFSKGMDTGLIKAEKLFNTYQNFQDFLKTQDNFYCNNNFINPKSLIPFYESFGLNCYQCFYGEWYPEEEMGNVYFSSIDNMISNMQDQSAFEENLAFQNFSHWLKFYIEGIL